MDGANERLHEAAQSGDAEKLQVPVALPCRIRALAVKWPRLGFQESLRLGADVAHRDGCGVALESNAALLRCASIHLNWPARAAIELRVLMPPIVQSFGPEFRYRLCNV
jgi:hypothetical protein